MNPISFQSFLEAIGGTAASWSSTPRSIASISLDSRTIQSGDVFWAIAGETFDGHNFVQDAFTGGASACVVSQNWKTLSEDNRLIRVPDTLFALQSLAAWYKTQFQIPTIGITGSYGKTTTRELLCSVLSTKASCRQSAGNQNNEIGVPLTVLGLNERHDYLIAELGAAKPGDIAPLVEIVKPNIGLITGIGLSHLEGFDSLENIILTKGDLFAGLRADGLAFVPAGKSWTEQLIQRANCRVVTFGNSQDSQYEGRIIRISNELLAFRCRDFEYNLPISGKHHLTTGLAVVAVASELGYTAEEIQDGFDRFRVQPGRGQVFAGEFGTLIDETYNANPKSTEAACRLLADWVTTGRRFLVLGDMLELGPLGETYHQRLGRLAADLEIDVVFAVGKFADEVAAGVRSNRERNTTVQTFETREDVIEELRTQLQPADVALIKGSRGSRMEQVVEPFKHSLPERNGLSTSCLTV